MTDSTTSMTIELAHGDTATISQYTAQGGVVYTQVKFSSPEASNTKAWLQHLNARFSKHDVLSGDASTFSLQGEHAKELHGIISGGKADAISASKPERPSKPLSPMPRVQVDSFAKQISRHINSSGSTAMGGLD